jgi:CheY-like chemotaxis protein
MLSAEGHSVRWTEDGEAALAALHEETFDIVILDMRMPKLDGRGTARTIRAMGGAYATIPILALTAEAFVEDAANAMAAGVNEVLSKPVDRQVLAATVARWVTRARQKTAAQSH